MCRIRRGDDAQLGAGEDAVGARGSRGGHGAVAHAVDCHFAALVAGECQQRVLCKVGGDGGVGGDGEGVVDSDVAVADIGAVEVGEVVRSVGRGLDSDIAAVFYLIGIRSGRSDDTGCTMINENLDGNHPRIIADSITLTIGPVIYFKSRLYAVRIDCERCFVYSVTTTVAESERASVNGKAIRGSDGNGAMISISILGFPAIIRRVIQLSFQCNLDSVVAPGTGSRGAGGEYYGRWQDGRERAAVVSGEGQHRLDGEVGRGSGVGGDVGVDLDGGVVVVADIGAVEVGEVVDSFWSGDDGDVGAVVNAVGAVGQLDNARGGKAGDFDSNLDVGAVVNSPMISATKATEASWGWCVGVARIA